MVKGGIDPTPVSLADICRQLKDASRNGGRTLNQIIEHAAHDSLVGWAGPGNREQSANPHPAVRRRSAP